MPTECPGGSQRPCGGNGHCGGDGSRQGNGLCQCHAGYRGELCLDCSDGYFSSLRNQTHSVCTGGCQPWGTEVMCGQRWAPACRAQPLPVRPLLSPSHRGTRVNPVFPPHQKCSIGAEAIAQRRGHLPYTRLTRVQSRPGKTPECRARSNSGLPWGVDPTPQLKSQFPSLCGPGHHQPHELHPLTPPAGNPGLLLSLRRHSH